MQTDAIRTAIENLSIAQLLRISRYARSCMQRMCLSCEDRDHDDAMSEAILLILSGDRPWDETTEFEEHLLKVIGGVIQEWQVTPDLDDRGLHAGIDPERQLLLREAWEQIQELFTGNERHNSVVQHLAEGMSVVEISMELNQSEEEIRRLVREIRVRIQRNLPDVRSFAMHLTSLR